MALMTIAFWAGDFVGQWRSESDIEIRLAKIEVQLGIHERKTGHSKVIERITALERDVDHLKYYEQLGIDD